MRNLADHGVLDCFQDLLDQYAEYGRTTKISLRAHIINAFQKAVSELWTEESKLSVRGRSSEAAISDSPMTGMPTPRPRSADDVMMTQTPRVSPVLSCHSVPETPASIPRQSRALTAAIPVILGVIETVDADPEIIRVRATKKKGVKRSDEELAVTVHLESLGCDLSLACVDFLGDMVSTSRDARTISVVETDRRRLALSFSGAPTVKSKVWIPAFRALEAQIKTKIELVDALEDYSFQCAPYELGPLFEPLIRNVVEQFAQFMHEVEAKPSEQRSSQEALFFVKWEGIRSGVQFGVQEQLKKLFYDSVKQADFNESMVQVLRYPNATCETPVSVDILGGLLIRKRALLCRDMAWLGEAIRGSVSGIKKRPKQLDDLLKVLSPDAQESVSQFINRWRTLIVQPERLKCVLNGVVDYLLKTSDSERAAFKKAWGFDLSEAGAVDSFSTAAEMEVLLVDFKAQCFQEHPSEPRIGWLALCREMIKTITCSEARAWLFYQQIQAGVAISLQKVKSGEAGAAGSLALDDVRSDSPESGRYMIKECCARSCEPLFHVLYLMIWRVEEELWLPLNGLRCVVGTDGQLIYTNTPQKLREDQREAGSRVARILDLSSPIRRPQLASGPEAPELEPAVGAPPSLLSSPRAKNRRTGEGPYS